MPEIMVFIPEISPLVINLPIIISIIAITRYIIGFKTWKNYPVIALSLAFYMLFQLQQGILFTAAIWFFFTVTTLGTAIGVRYLLRKYKMNYYARVAMMYLGATVLSVIFLSLFNPIAKQVPNGPLFFAVGIFLIGSTIDEFATLQFKKDLQEFTRRVSISLTIAAISGLLLTFPAWNAFLSNHQEIIPAVLVLDIIVAMWSALRLTEIIRFGSIGKN